MVARRRVFDILPGLRRQRPGGLGLSEMKCVVTAGPAIEPLDEVRRLSNFSTGRLGTELAAFLAHLGHQVILLRSESAVFTAHPHGVTLQLFSSSKDLAELLEKLARRDLDSVFHAAAVSDFTFGKVYQRSEDGALLEIESRKFSTAQRQLLVELKPVPKIIARLRDWFPRAYLAGWKYEVEGGRDDLIDKGRTQLQINHTNCCVLNGPGYGPGYGVLTDDGSYSDFSRKEQLFFHLEKIAWGCLR